MRKLIIITVTAVTLLIIAGVSLTIVGANANQQRQQDKAKTVLDCVGENIKSSTTRRCTTH